MPWHRPFSRNEASPRFSKVSPQKSFIGPQLSAFSYLHSVIGNQSRKKFDTAHLSRPRPTTGLLIGRNQDNQDSFVVSPGECPEEATCRPNAIFGHWSSTRALKTEIAGSMACVPASNAVTQIKKTHHRHGSKALVLAWPGSWRTLGLAFAVPNLHLDPPLVMATVLSPIF